MTKKYKGVWPPPSYVATFEGGEEVRVSLGLNWLPGKPYDFERARRATCQMIGNERGRGTVRKKRGPFARVDAVWPPATDIIKSYLEHDGRVYSDPFDGGAKTTPKVDPVARLLAQALKLDAAQQASLIAALQADQIAAIARRFA